MDPGWHDTKLQVSQLAQVVTLVCQVVQFVFSRNKTLNTAALFGFNFIGNELCCVLPNIANGQPVQTNNSQKYNTAQEAFK